MVCFESFVMIISLSTGLMTAMRSGPVRALWDLWQPRENKSSRELFARILRDVLLWQEDQMAVAARFS